MKNFSNPIKYYKLLYSLLFIILEISCTYNMSNKMNEQNDTKNNFEHIKTHDSKAFSEKRASCCDFICALFCNKPIYGYQATNINYVDDLGWVETEEVCLATIKLKGYNLLKAICCCFCCCNCDYNDINMYDLWIIK